MTNNTIDSIVELISKEDVIAQFGEAMAASITASKAVTWAKFILTDDKPNKNGQRVPQDEFDNLINSGIFKPVKMAMGEIKDGHEDAKPLGVITNLTKDGNKIVALAALWDHERTEDVSTIKEMVNKNKPVNVSWEILYSSSTVKNGIVDLLGTILRAVTIVGMPAYAGRTQLLAVAAIKWSPAYIENLPDENFMYIERDGTRYFAFKDAEGSIDPSRFPSILEEMEQAPIPQNTLKDIKAQVGKLLSDASISGGKDINTEDYKLEKIELESKVSELTAQLALANNTLDIKEKELVTAKAQLDEANTAVKTLEEELNPLREFKDEANKVVERAEKLSAVKAKFEALKLVKEDSYYEENADKLLSLDDNGLDFLLQEMVAFVGEDKGEGEASLLKKRNSGIPNIQVSQKNLTDPKELAKALTEHRNSGKK